MIAAVVGVIFLVGCGGSSDSTAPTISKVAFVKKANRICDDTEKQYLARGFTALAKAQAEKPQASTTELEDEVVARMFVPTYRKEIEELRELGTPEGDEKQIEAIFRELERLLDRVERDPAKYRLSQAEFRHPYRAAQRLAAAYGIQACGEP